MKKMIDIRSLKEFALREIPPDCPLREILLAEKDEIDADEFIVKVPVFLRLYSLKNKRQSLRNGRFRDVPPDLGHKEAQSQDLQAEAA